MRLRLPHILLLLACIFASGCCGDPKDPKKPGATKEARFVDDWLDDLAANRDSDANGKLRFVGAPPKGWSDKRFGQRVDRMGLRSIGKKLWTKAHYLLSEPNPNSKDPMGDYLLRKLSNMGAPLALEAQVEIKGKTRTLALIVYEDKGMKIGAVTLDGARLVPSGDPTITTAPMTPKPPGKRLRRTTLSKATWGDTPHLQARFPGPLPATQSARLQADCLYDDKRWHRHVIVTGTKGLSSLSARLRSDVPERCSVTLKIFEDRTQQQRAWCWTPKDTDKGLCPETPPLTRKSKAPVFIDKVAPVVLTDKTFTVAYDLYPNQALPPAGDELRHHIKVSLQCGDSKPQIATRPLSKNQDPPGLHQSFAALYSNTKALDLPCDVVFKLFRESPYERKSWTLFKGCTTLTDVRQGPCDKR